MIINGKEFRSVWFENDVVKFIDQRKIPQKFEIFVAKTVKDVTFAITEMVVRGAPAIGAAAVFGMALGKNDPEKSSKLLKNTRPTAHDLFFAIDIIYKKLKDMHKSIKSSGSCDFKDFKNFLLKHKDFEEKDVYSIFDQELDEITKKMIVDRIDEIKINDSGLKNIKVKCSECGKKIGIFTGYHHSKLDKRWHLCSVCYDKI